MPGERFDPQFMAAGLGLAGRHIEAGGRSFATYVSAMQSDLGEAARPYLKCWYNAFRDFPGFENRGMTPVNEVDDEAQALGLAHLDNAEECHAGSEIAYVLTKREEALGLLAQLIRAGELDEYLREVSARADAKLMDILANRPESPSRLRANPVALSAARDILCATLMNRSGEDAKECRGPLAPCGVPMKWTGDIQSSLRQLCDVRATVHVFSETRFAELAKAVAERIEGMPALGVYGDDFGFRTLWDEYCYEVQQGPTDLLEVSWDDVVDPLIIETVGAFSHPEGQLLTVGAHWMMDEEEGLDPSTVNRDLLARALRRAVDSAAMRRNMSDFESRNFHTEDEDYTDEEEDVVESADADGEGDIPQAVAWRELTADDCWQLRSLRNVVRDLASAAQAGRDLIAVGKAWQTLDSVLGGEHAPLDVEIAFGFRTAGPTSGEGLSVSLRVNDERIRINRMDCGWDKWIDPIRVIHKPASVPTGRFFPRIIAGLIPALSGITRSDGVSINTSSHGI